MDRQKNCSHKRNTRKIVTIYSGNLFCDRVHICRKVKTGRTLNNPLRDTLLCRSITRFNINTLYLIQSYCLLVRPSAHLGVHWRKKLGLAIARLYRNFSLIDQVRRSDCNGETLTANERFFIFGTTLLRPDRHEKGWTWGETRLKNFKNSYWI